MTRSEAEQLARRLEAYWKSKGSTAVLTRVEPYRFGRDNLFVVRSNLINGCPPDWDKVQKRSK